MIQIPDDSPEEESEINVMKCLPSLESNSEEENQDEDAVVAEKAIDVYIRKNMDN